MQAIILGCGSLLSHIEAAQAKMQTDFPVVELDRKYHVDPRQMQQEILTKLQQLPAEVDTVLVAMGCPGVPGGAIIMTTILLTNMGLPLEIVGLIAGIFRLIDMADTVFNVTGDVVTTMVVARSENMIQPPAAARK